MEKDFVKHQRFIVFGFTDFYPGGGIDDVIFSGSNLEECMTFVDIYRKNKINLGEQIQIFDCDKRQIISEFRILE